MKKYVFYYQDWEERESGKQEIIAESLEQAREWFYRLYNRQHVAIVGIDVIS